MYLSHLMAQEAARVKARSYHLQPLQPCKRHAEITYCRSLSQTYLSMVLRGWQCLVLQAAEGVGTGKSEPKRSRASSHAKENYPAPPFYNTSPTGLPPKGQLYPDLPPPDMPTCRG